MGEENKSQAPFEARAWLAGNRNRHALAANKFDNTEKARIFVEHLYSLGATEVLVDHLYGEDWRIQQEGGPYADTIIVKLPSDRAARRLLFRSCNEEIEIEGDDPVEDVGQDRIDVWWD
jgi:hypothetical protein